MKGVYRAISYINTRQHHSRRPKRKPKNAVPGIRREGSMWHARYSHFDLGYHPTKQAAIDARNEQIARVKKTV